MHRARVHPLPSCRMSRIQFATSQPSLHIEHAEPVTGIVNPALWWDKAAPTHGRDVSSTLLFLSVPVDHVFSKYVCVEVNLFSGKTRIINLPPLPFETLVEKHGRHLEGSATARFIMYAGVTALSRAYTTPPRPGRATRSGAVFPVLVSPAPTAPVVPSPRVSANAIGGRSALKRTASPSAFVGSLPPAKKTAPACSTCGCAYIHCACKLTCLLCNSTGDACKCTCTACGSKFVLCTCLKAVEPIKSTCWGCETDQPNQMAHMEAGGCLEPHCYRCGKPTGTISMCEC